MSRAAIFLDRDGVINRRRVDHVKSWSEFEFLPGTLDALRTLREREAIVVVVTNQSAVGRGLVSLAELNGIHREMVTAVAASGGGIERVYYCPHSPSDGCRCRKPGIDMLRRAAAELDVDLQQSVLVGDSPSDVQAAQSAGCIAVLIAAEEPPATVEPRVTVVANLVAALAPIAQLLRSEKAPC
ncbi:MAG: HAD family hydrolase [Candidatus Dormibacteraeota bacterium]|nr:HAD family hydrolase [Candidatus Dormibacteraeota bacterium]